jgi:hypothetical protein
MEMPTISVLEASLSLGMLVELKTIVVGPTGGGEVETLATQLDAIAPSKETRHFRHWLCVRHHSANNLLDGPDHPVTDSVAPHPLPVKEKEPALPWLHSKATAFLFAADEAESSCGSVHWLVLPIALCRRR